MRNVLVTGSSGFVGKNLVKKLIYNGDKVYVLIRNKKNNQKLNNDFINYIYSDSYHLNEINDLPQMDVCYNLAAYGVRYTDQDINQMIDANIMFLINILKFIKKNKTKLLVHTGTCFEYGLTNSEVINESSILNPKSLYGATKMAGTSVANVYARMNDINMITLRPFGIYGPGESNVKLFPQIINSGIKNTILKMTKGDQIRDYLYIDDLIDAYIDISLSDNLDTNGFYNVCSSNAISIKQLVEKICKVCKFNSEIFKFGEIQYRKNEVMKFVGDNSKIKNVVNWMPKTSLEEGIKKTYLYYKIKESERL